MVLGIGKQRRIELNHSTVVDLIFVHNDDVNCNDYESFHQKRLKTSRILIDVLSDRTSEGFINRVDMRLRLGGDQSPLVQSLEEKKEYYSATGELWEQQALIKGNPVAGSVTTAEIFMKMITPSYTVA